MTQKIEGQYFRYTIIVTAGPHDFFDAVVSLSCLLLTADGKPTQCIWGYQSNPLMPTEKLARLNKLSTSKLQETKNAPDLVSDILLAGLAYQAGTALNQGRTIESIDVHHAQVEDAGPKSAKKVSLKLERTKNTTFDEGKALQLLSPLKMAYQKGMSPSLNEPSFTIKESGLNISATIEHGQKVDQDLMALMGSEAQGFTALLLGDESSAALSETLQEAAYDSGAKALDEFLVDLYR